jgi:methionyl-tRNA formyltransferase
MKIFLFVGARRGYVVLKKLIEESATICAILCLIEDAHEEQYHIKVTALAQEHAIPIFYSNVIKPAEYANIMQQVNPDIAFAIGWRYMITKNAYTIPAKGTFVIHDSLLPKYRGFAPMNWAIINGEKETGVTLFYIAEGVDSGNIIDQLSLPIHLLDTAKTVDDNIVKLYEKIIIKNLPLFESNEIKSIAQDESLATYSCKRTPEDGEINWQNTALQIYNLIRGLTHPFPGAYTTLKGVKIYIWDAELPEKAEAFVGTIPGRVIGKKNGTIEVLTGNGLLRLKSLQYIGDNEKKAEDISISVKDTFGR